MGSPLGGVLTSSSSSSSAAEDLARVQSHLRKHLLSFTNSMSVKCAIELGIPDAIHKHGKPMSLSDLSTALSIPPSKTPHLRRLMRLLVHSRFFSQTGAANNEEEDDDDEEEEMFTLTELSEILAKESSICNSPMVLLGLDQMFQKPWHHLSTWLKCDDHEHPTAFEIAHGRVLFEAMREMPEFNRMFNDGMSSDSNFTTRLLLMDGCCGRDVCRGINSLVDVGGGRGTMACAISQAFPDLKCTVLDLPHVVEGLEGTEMVKFVGGDMFTYVPPADAVLLKWILHDWDNQVCVKILKQCKEAIPMKEYGGKVVIIDTVMKTKKL